MLKEKVILTYFTGRHNKYVEEHQIRQKLNFLAYFLNTVCSKNLKLLISSVKHGGGSIMQDSDSDHTVMATVDQAQSNWISDFLDFYL